MYVDMKGKEYKKTFNDVQNKFRLISSNDEVFSSGKEEFHPTKGKLFFLKNSTPRQGMKD
jgi:hypothetical protein